MTRNPQQVDFIGDHLESGEKCEIFRWPEYQIFKEGASFESKIPSEYVFPASCQIFANLREEGEDETEN